MTTQVQTRQKHTALEPTHGLMQWRYDLLSRVLHWIFALVILYAIVVGYSLSHIRQTALREILSTLNMSLATVLIPLFPVRLIWRHLRPPVLTIPGTSLQHGIARCVHDALYITVGCVLASGYLMVPGEYRFFWLLTIPTPLSHGKLVNAIFLIHRASCAILAGLVALHVLAVLKHQCVTRIPFLNRMC